MQLSDAGLYMYMYMCDLLVDNRHKRVKDGTQSSHKVLLKYRLLPAYLILFKTLVGETFAYYASSIISPLSRTSAEILL